MGASRLLLLAASSLTFFAASARPADDAPLWDGRESVASYAARVHLAATRSVDLGGGVTLDLVLIPAGNFVMGTAEPSAPASTVKSAQVLLAVGASLAFALVATLLKFRKRGGRFSFSLRWLLAFCLACSLIVGGGARWHLAIKEAARYDAEYPVYKDVPDEEKHAHRVTLTQPFYIGKYTVTQAQYEALIGGNPSHFKGAQLPVECVSWYDAAEFCKKLSARMNDKTLEAHLPTEAQWEYACRAGTTTAYYSGNRESDLDAVAWYKTKNPRYKTQPVGSKKPNMFGLYDMHGNVWQWCADAYTERYQELSAVDPFNELGTYRVLRGGSWFFEPKFCRSAARYYGGPRARRYIIGFRVVLVPSSRTTP